MQSRRPNFRRIKKKNAKEPPVVIRETNKKLPVDLDVNSTIFKKSRIKSRNTSVTCKGTVIQPPTSTPMPTRNGVTISRPINNFNLHNVPEKYVTQAVYMGSGLPVPAKKVFREYSKTKRKDEGERLVKWLYIVNTNFLERALSTGRCNLTIIIEQARKIEDWYIREMGFPEFTHITPQCPSEIRKHLSGSE